MNISGKKDEVSFVIACNVHEIAHLADEFVEVRNRAGLHLAGGDAHVFHPARHPCLGAGFLVHEGIAPYHLHGVAAAALVLGKVIREDSDGLESVGQLEAQHGIVDLARNDLLEIVLWPVDPAPALAQVRHPSVKDDALQLQLLGQLAAFLVKPSPDAGAARLGIDAQLVTIQPVAIGIVPRAVAVAGDLVPGMRAQGLVTANAHGGTVSDQLVVEERDEAAFGIVVDLSPDLALRVGGEILIDALCQRSDPADIADFGLANFETCLGHKMEKPPLRRINGATGVSFPT